MFTKILIANRGEIACRIIRSARRMGITTVAVYSEVDRSSLHVEMADEAYLIGEAPALSSYLNINKIVEIAKLSGAEAIHPGYGFLSENPEFARSCEKAGIVFIGPSAKVIREMGIKGHAKKVMADAGIPVIPGGEISSQPRKSTLKEIEQAGYPVLIKADCGGGGKGIRQVNEASELEEAIAAATREALSSFGDGSLLWEKRIEAARHIEVQIFRDSHGKALHLFERDCSLQRRHQKIIEEAPAGKLAPGLAQNLYKAALMAADTIDYRGAGTVEFLVDKNSAFYFLEINTRLQVEHPVTEGITGYDLVEWQLQIAAGDPLPYSQQDVKSKGHSFEARIYAEDPAKGFLPSTGFVHHLHEPEHVTNVRVDSGIREGDTITPYYDPILAKLIVHGRDRTVALKTLTRALEEYRLAGVAINRDFLLTLTKDSLFSDSLHTIEYIDENLDALLTPGKVPLYVHAAAALLFHHQIQQESIVNQQTADPYSPWSKCNGFRLNQNAAIPVTLHHENDDIIANISEHGTTTVVQLDDKRVVLSDVTVSDRSFSCSIEKRLITINPIWVDGELTMFYPGGSSVYRVPSLDEIDDDSSDSETTLRAPIPGSVTEVFVENGQTVKAGEQLMVLEAMKMEYMIKAPSDGVIVEILYKKGDGVKEGERLLLFETSTHQAEKDG